MRTRQSWKYGVFLALLFFAAGISACESSEPGPVYVVCGGVSNFQCPNNYYCKLEAKCGGIDREGICAPRPVNCPIDEEPICGCDGKTYVNACIAASRGVTEKSTGACVKVKNEPPKEFRLATDIPCAGPKNFTCPSDMFCDLGKECGGIDRKGFCAFPPEDCPIDKGKQVCGCDDKNYGNACLANKNFVTVKHEGMCLEIE